jgi:ABC-type nitrate/sulfonate/bicarbonate transport system substrate-binding protein
MTSPSLLRRTLVALAGTAVAVLALGACSSAGATSPASSGSSADKKTLSVQLSWVKNEEFSGEFFADSKGYYKDAGLTSVTLTPGPSTGAAELLSGKADVAFSDAVSTGSVVASEGAPLKIIGTTYQKNPFTVLSLKSKGNIATPADLKGKKIGVQDSNTALFKALLAANGLKDGDVTIVPVQYDPAPLLNGEVDGYIAYLTNESITVAAQGVETTNLPFADNGLPFVAETVTTTDDMIAKHRETLKSFLTAEIKGWTDAVKDPAAGAKLAVDTYGKDLKLNLANSTAGATAQAEKLVVSDETAKNGLFTISDTLQQSTIKSLGRAGITLKASDLFDMSLLDEVYKAHPELVKYAG